MPTDWLITGAGSGLGRYLYERFGGVALTRDVALDDLFAAGRTFDVIIHCAFNASRELVGEALRGYIADNLLLTERLTRLPHRRFVYLSTVDVYPRANRRHREDQPVALAGPCSAYAATKLMSEALVRHRSKAHLILRPTTMLGRYSRPNSLIHLLTKEDCVLTVAAESEFNCVLHRDVADFIELCLAHGHAGTYNLASRSNLRLGTLARRLGRAPRFGRYLYRVGRIDNSRAAALSPAFRRSSYATLAEFLKGIGEWER